MDSHLLPFLAIAGLVVAAAARTSAGSSSVRSSRAEIAQMGFDADRLLRAMEFTPSGRSAGPSGLEIADHLVPGIDLRPPVVVRKAAMRGLRLRHRGFRGGTDIGLGRAVQLATADEIPPRDLLRMSSYFARHASDRRAKGFGDPEKPSPGYIAWLLWGGDAGRDWAVPLAEQIRKARQRIRKN